MQYQVNRAWLCRLLVLLTVVGLTICAHADLFALKQEYEGKIEALVAERDKNFESAGKKYMGYLDKLIKQEAEAGKLDSALILRNEWERLAKSKDLIKPAPEKESEVMGDAYAKYQAAIEVVYKSHADSLRGLFKNYDDAHEKLEKELIKQDRLNEAVNVRAARKALPDHPAWVEARRYLGMEDDEGNEQAANSGCVLHLSFDEVKDGFVADDSGKGNHGKVKGATANAGGKKGGCLSFNGTNAYVSVPHSDSLSLTDQFTLSAWVKPQSMRGFASIIGKGREGEGHKDPHVYFLRVRPERVSKGASKLHAYFLHNDENATGVLSKTSWKSDEWMHVASTYDGKNLSIYINGRLEGQESAYNKRIAVSKRALEIGRRFGDANSVFNGYIDEVAIYDRALTSGQIEKLAEP